MEPPARPTKAQKGVKRKADTTTSFDEEAGSSKTDNKAAIKRDNRQPVKRPPPPIIDYAQLKPRYKGKFSEQMKYCQKILSQLRTKICKVYFL